MPNHCTNDVTIKLRAGKTGNALEVARKLKSFENILPSPKEFEGICSGGCEIEGIDTVEKAAPYYGWEHITGIGPAKGKQWISFRFWRETSKDGTRTNVPITLEEARELIAKYGCIGWYDWCIANWGTKWDAYDIVGPHGNKTSAFITFDTAWSPPTPVLEALAAQHPEMAITNRWREEGGQKGYDRIQPKTSEQLRAQAAAEVEQMRRMNERIAQAIGRA